tara:strand:+ start:5237 stop:5704 length:468 start_codon:yes stop_codon:yes gene_type:complete
MDYARFFKRNPEEVARDLVGRSLIRNAETGSVSGKILETGAYRGGKETPSRSGMKYAPGTIFLMPFRGSLFLNIASEKEGFPSCVEIRKVAFFDEATTGPGAVTRYLALQNDLDGVILGDELEIEGRSSKNVVRSLSTGRSDNCLGYYLERSKGV